MDELLTPEVLEAMARIDSAALALILAGGEE